MPLELNDPRWNELRTSYGACANVIAWLRDAYAQRSLSEERLGDLVNEVMHQGGTSTAMYAVASHLIKLSQFGDPEYAMNLLVNVGLIYASATGPRAVACPDFLRKEFGALAPEAAQTLANLLPLATEFDVFKYAVAALAGLMGHRRFGRFLQGLDYFKGQYYHNWLDQPFPPEM